MFGRNAGEAVFMACMHGMFLMVQRSVGKISTACTRILHYIVVLDVSKCGLSMIMLPFPWRSEPFSLGYTGRHQTMPGLFPRHFVCSLER